MKKRKKPILLATILAVFVGIVAVINAFNSTTAAGAHGEPPPAASGETPTSVTGDSRSSVSKDQLAKAARAASTADAPPTTASSPGPKILQSNEAGYKPKPHDSTLGSHWYTEEGAKSYKTGKN